MFTENFDLLASIDPQFQNHTDSAKETLLSIVKILSTIILK
jgi:hypothetical protein